MSILLLPTQIKQSFYLLVPKSIADLLEIEKKSKFSLSVKKNGEKNALEYILEKDLN